MLFRLEKYSLLFSFKLSDVCTQGNFYPLMGVTKPRVAGCWAPYWSACVYSYPVLDGNSRKLRACLSVGLWPKLLCRQGGVSPLSSADQASVVCSVSDWAGRQCCMLVFTASFLESGANSTRTAGLVKYSWSQRWDKCTQCYQGAISACQILRLLVLGRTRETILKLLGLV